MREALAGSPRADAGSQDVNITVSFASTGADAGILFGADVAVTCQQLNRARAWVPCVDAATSRHSWDLRVEAPTVCTVVASGDLVGRSKGGARTRTWHYRLAAAAPARAVVFAAGPLNPFTDERAAAALRVAIAESLAPAEDAAAPTTDAAMPEGPDAALTGFGTAQTEASGLLAGTCGAMRLVQCLLEQWLLCKLPWPLFSLVFLPEWACQVCPSAAR